MRTTKSVSISNSLPAGQYKVAARLARKQKRTMSDLFREGLRRLEMEEKAGVGAELLAALRDVQHDARKAGLDRMTGRAIAAEVAAARRAGPKTPSAK